MSIQSESKYIIVKRARNGKGLFARKNFKAGSVILLIKGKRYHWAVVKERGGVFLDNCFRFGPETYLSPEGSLAEFVNHSCEPNSKIIKNNNQLYLVALVNIPKGGEIVFDYAGTLAADDIWTMKCNCGAKTCRGIVRKYTRLPKKLQQVYITNGVIPRYILAL
jgi:uncharacterized protein